MIDRLDRLRHHAVIGRDDNDRHVGHLRTAGTHGSKRFMARSVEESDTAAVYIHAVSADMLRNTSGFAGDHVGFADIVQQRSLTVVDVAHHGHDRRTRYQVFRFILFGVDSLLRIDGDEFDLIAELFGHHHQCFCIETLVDRHHQAEVHAGRNDVGNADIHHRGELADGNELGYLQDTLFAFFACLFLLYTSRYRIALVAAVLGRLEFGSFGSQAGQCILDLLLYLFLTHFGVHRSGFRSTLRPPLLVVITERSAAGASARTGTTRCGTAVGTRCARSRFLVQVDFILGNALAFLAAAEVALFLKQVHVDLAEHLRSRQAVLLRIGAKQVRLVGSHTLVIRLGLRRSIGRTGRNNGHGLCRWFCNCSRFGCGRRRNGLGRSFSGRRSGCCLRCGG